MKIGRSTARCVLGLLILGGLAWVEAALHAHHWYRLTYEYCNSPDMAVDSTCIGWKREALYAGLAVLAFGAAAILWNERRKE